MDRQAVFNRVVNHLLNQNQHCRSEISGVCRYREIKGSTTFRCAIGALIPDDRYDSAFEGALLIDCPEIRHLLQELFGPLDEKDRRLLYALQAAHDSFDVKFWPAQLFAIAVREGLEYQPEKAQ